MKLGETGNVAAGAEERGRAERDEPGISKQEIEPESIQGVNRDFGCKAGSRADPRQYEWQDGKQNARNHNGMRKPAPGRLHSNRSQLSPNKPRGRTRRTTIMSAYITALDAAGQN